EGTMDTYCPSKPAMEYMSGGAPGIHLSSGLPGSPAFSQNWAPYLRLGALGVGVVLYFIHPSGRMRSACHTPSLRQSKPKRAQSRAVAYMKEEPTKVPEGSGSMTALAIPILSNSAW